MSALDSIKNTVPATKGITKNIAKSAGSALGVNFALDLAINKLTGSSWGEALGRTARDTAFLALAPGAYAAYAIASGVMPLAGAYYRGGKAVKDRHNEFLKRLETPTFSYQDTQQAVTMRQAAIQAIQGSKLNARNALGGEAALMHRSFKDGRY